MILCRLEEKIIRELKEEKKEIYMSEMSAASGGILNMLFRFGAELCGAWM